MGRKGSTLRRAVSGNKLAPIERFLSDGIFITAQGSYGRCFGIKGCDPDGAMPEHLRVVSSRITDLLRSMSRDVTLYQYFLSIEGFRLTTESDRPAARRRTMFL